MVGRHWARTADAGGAGRFGPVDRARSTQSSELISLLEQTLGGSRPVLLGSRDPRPSCVSVVKRGEIQTTLPVTEGDADGGPGTRLSTLYSLARQGITSAMQDYTWHQIRLLTLLENEKVLNGPAMELSHRLAERARSSPPPLMSGPPGRSGGVTCRACRCRSRGCRRAG